MTPINNNQMSELREKIEKIIDKNTHRLESDPTVADSATYPWVDTEIVIKELSTLISHERAEAEKVTGETSDGYHTFKELYEFRKLYNACFFNGKFVSRVHKSKRHSDGELCFGGGWFIVVGYLPIDGKFVQISNHYEMKDWDLFTCIELEKADEWDGHTPQDVAKRLEQYLSPNKSDGGER